MQMTAVWKNYSEIIGRYEVERDYINRLVDSGKYDTEKPFWGTAFRYNKQGGALYNEANIVTKDFPSNYEGSTALTLPGTDAVRGAVQAIGNLNGDGWLSVADAVLLARYIAEDRDVRLSAEAAAEADLDCDGTVGGLDLAVLLARIADLESYSAAIV